MNSYDSSTERDFRHKMRILLDILLYFSFLRAGKMGSRTITVYINLLSNYTCEPLNRPFDPYKSQHNNKNSETHTHTNTKIIILIIYFNLDI